MTVETLNRTLLPGIAVAGIPAAPAPHQLLLPGTLLLGGVSPGHTVGLAEHQQRWGLLPTLDLVSLTAAAESVGLVGAGGAGFPTARKLRSVQADKSGPVIVNGSEGETASGKDTVLLSHVPHLVLDAAVMTARALGAREVIVRIPHTRQHVIDIVVRAIDERHDGAVRIRVSPGEDSFVAGEASAVISSLQGGPAKPIPAGKPPHIKSGLRRRPVMLSNVETFARLAVAARGHRTRSSLVTISGATTVQGVLEVPVDTPLRQILEFAGADADVAAIITGGWHGTWLAPTPSLLATAVNRDALRAVGAHWGAGAIVVIGRGPCPVDVLTAITNYLVGEGARQCAPCILGLDKARDDLRQGAPVVDRVGARGLCAHPTAAIAAMRSGQQLLAAEIARHAAGTCSARVGSPS